MLAANFPYACFPYKILRKHILLVSALFISIVSLGQTDFRPGYYITWENDTVYGLIDFRGAKRNSDHCLFKETEKSEPVQFNPTDISAYRFTDSKFYVSKEIEINDTERQAFLEFLVNGITDIYYYSGEDHTCYFIEGKNGRLIELTNDMIDEYIEGEGHFRRESKKYIGVLKATLADCEEVQEDIEKAGLNHKSLINIGKKYHEYVCDNDDCIVYEKPVPKFKFKFAPFIGINFIKLSFPETNHFDSGLSYSEFDFNSAIAPSIGFVFNTSIPQLNEKLSVDIGASVYQFKTSAIAESKPDFIVDVYDAQLEFTSLQTMIALKYSFPKGSIRPTLALGFASNFFLSKSQTVSIKRYYNGDEIDSKEKTDYFPVISALHGLYTELGSDYTVGNHHTFFTTIKLNLLGNYKGNFAGEGENGIKTKLVTTNVSLGMYLGKNK